jgi:hypothetical protein
VEQGVAFIRSTLTRMNEISGASPIRISGIEEVSNG